jgi:heterodisulfide reductase subunit A
MTDSVLIIGGGVAGLHAALECAASGARAIVVERGPVLGGRLAATMSDAAAIGERSEGARTPLFDAIQAQENIEFLTLSELDGIEGRPGHFTATVRERPRFVTDACTRCKNCHVVCPVVRPNEADAGLTYRKALYTPMHETLPAAWVIDIESCLNTPPNYLPCQRCVGVCDDNAIDFHMALGKTHEFHVGALLLAPGFRSEGPERFRELGYGAHPDVVTSAELQRLLESPGPTGGFASRPSDEEYPESVLLVLDNPSDFALYIVASQAHQLVGQDIETVSVLVLAQPAVDADGEAMRKLGEEAGIEVHWGASFKVEPREDQGLEVSYQDLSSNRLTRESWDMVVHCVDVEPPEGLAELAAAAGVDLTADGWVKVDESTLTSRPGVFAAGCASGPKHIRASLEEACSAAAAATACLDPRLLDGSVAEARAEASGEPPTPPPEDMRAHIEKLLHALLDQ